MRIFGKELKFNGFDVFHKGNQKVWVPELSQPDEDNFLTIISYRRGDGTLFLEIEFINKIKNVYQNYTVTNYAEDGISITSQDTYELPTDNTTTTEEGY